MCRVDLNIQFTDLEGTGVLATQAAYKKVGTTVWIPFTLDINNQQTPDLQETGQYDLRVRLFNGVGWSNWFYTQFFIGCGAFNIGYNQGFKI